MCVLGVLKEFRDDVQNIPSDGAGVYAGVRTPFGHRPEEYFDVQWFCALRQHVLHTSPLLPVQCPLAGNQHRSGCGAWRLLGSALLLS